MGKTSKTIELSERAALTCAMRMARTLASKGKHHNTRKYVQTLPKRPPISLTPSDFGFIPPTVEQVHTVAKQIVEAPRKDKRRPRAEPHVLPKNPNATPRGGRDLTQNRVLRRRLWMAQNGRCTCGERIFKPSRGSLDHVVPLYHGGADEAANLMLLHPECNMEKDNRMPTWAEVSANREKNKRLALTHTSQ